MSETTRRDFLSSAGKAALAGGSGIFAINNIEMTAKNMFIHHVYFWLKNPSIKEDYEKLLSGIESLGKISTLKLFHLGKPAGTSRDVIDSSYSFSLLTIFDDEAGHDAYQVDPIHLKFVEECKHLWSRVVVYDSLDAR